jgi:hypothetical protein
VDDKAGDKKFDVDYQTQDVQTYLNNADVMNLVVEGGRKKMVSRSALELGSPPTRSISRN